MIYHGTYNSGAMTTPLLQLAGLCSSKKRRSQKPATVSYCPVRGSLTWLGKGIGCQCWGKATLPPGWPPESPGPSYFLVQGPADPDDSDDLLCLTCPSLPRHQLKRACLTVVSRVEVPCLLCLCYVTSFQEIQGSHSAGTRLLRNQSPALKDSKE